MRCFSASRADPAGGTVRRQATERSEGKRRNGPKASSRTERGETAKRPVCEKWNGARASSETVRRQAADRSESKQNGP